MGGLRRAMPLTFWTFLIGSLSLSGIPPFSGFWSKDEILRSAWDDNVLLFLLGFVTVFLTAFYMFRAIMLTFFGSYRGGAEPETPDGGGPVYLSQQHGDEAETSQRPGTEPPVARELPEAEWRSGHPHESPWVMLLPLVVLSVPAVLTGFLNLNGGFGDLIKGALPANLQGINPETTNWGVLVGSSAVALLGILAAVIVYQPGRQWDRAIGRALRPAWVFLTNRMYLDALDENVLVRYIFYRGICNITQIVDAYVIDGAVNGAGWVTRRTGSYLRQVQDGELQTYGFVFLTGVVLIAALVFALHP